MYSYKSTDKNMNSRDYFLSLLLSNEYFKKVQPPIFPPLLPQLFIKSGKRDIGINKKF